jgi:hypothetical protein
MTHTEIAILEDARKTARSAGLAVFEKAGKYLLYRLCQPRNVLVASTGKADRLKTMVLRAAATTQAKAA